MTKSFQISNPFESPDFQDPLIKSIRDYRMVKKDDFIILCHRFFSYDLEQEFSELGVKPSGSFKCLQYHIAYFMKDEADFHLVRLHIGLQKEPSGLKFYRGHELLK